MTGGICKAAVFPVAALLGLIALPDAAAACRIVQFPDAVRQGADAAVVVRLTEVRPVGDQTRFYTWRAVGETREVVFGEPDSERFEFGGAYASTGCRGGQPPVGDLWALYLEDTDGRLRVTAWHPLSDAEELDPRVAGLNLER